ncbi:MAG: isoleucine--tRNA ligase [Bacteroidia bacterium]|nr:isoleucine--tRNA ligase [Bacteroidia bacterium]
MHYKEFKQLDLAAIHKELLHVWQNENTFEKSIELRNGCKPFTFYEGPPSANGLPGIHHVMARSIKDIFCRYKTLQGYQVKRKGGWDTHGLPIEISVEKTLGITKEDIGTKISVEDYNKACRTEVMKYKDVWDDLTVKMGYWVDLQNPYVTFENEYIESVWHLLQMLYDKKLLYKGYTIQPYSPAAGTGLSSHELNQPGTYRNVRDTSIVAQFKITNSNNNLVKPGAFLLAWTTTPWTLPSNSALAIGEKITYAIVDTYNAYTHQPITVVLAKALLPSFFADVQWEIAFDAYKPADKTIPCKLIGEVNGRELIGIQYAQLMPYVTPQGKAFEVIAGDFVSTEDGTGIVHIAPTFGADDARVAKQAGIEAILVTDDAGKPMPLVDKQGRFVKHVTDFASEYVKQEYLTENELEAAKKQQGRENYLSVDERIAIKLKTENKAFKVARYEHSYPHCWRTDKPVLYYPLDSWFIRTTAYKDQMLALNKTINWKPESTGTGRFGNWLENLVDWNLSRSRFWGIPLPIWRNDDGEEKCIGSIDELRIEMKKAIDAGFIDEKHLEFIDPNSPQFDLHRPYVDHIVLVSDTGKKLWREPDLIDVWFDSGAMPYAQWHYMGKKDTAPFGKEPAFPADFIAEGVDQTRGWFFTLHAIATMLFDSVAFKNVVSNGLVLDKNGNKMSKRLGNAVDPFSTLDKYGADATRWYMISNAQPWDNLKFNLEGITETQRRFFGTLYNTYSFFALYANIDKYVYSTENKNAAYTELDHWILSKLQNLITEVSASYDEYEPTKATRAIETFVDEHLSNWYVRLGRRRFWRNDMNADKQAAYDTLFNCLHTVSQLMSPVAPFFADWLYRNLMPTNEIKSVHHTLLAPVNTSLINVALEDRMQLAQDICSLVLSLRKKVNIRVRQPLQKILLPALEPGFKEKVMAVQSLILTEVNVKQLEFIDDDSGIITKKAKPNFKQLGKKAGPHMKALTTVIENFTQQDIAQFEKQNRLNVVVNDMPFVLEQDDLQILSEDVAGWQVARQNQITVALDVNITPELMHEGIARELVNRIQNLRKEKGYEVTDKITVEVLKHPVISVSVTENKKYICAEILATSLELVDELNPSESAAIEVDETLKTQININKL